MSRVSRELLLLGDVEIALDAAFFWRGWRIGASRHRIECCRPHEYRSANLSWRLGAGTGGSGIRKQDRPGGSQNCLRSERRRTFHAFAAGRDGFWRLTTLDLQVEPTNRIPPPDFSELTELVVRAAELGDEVAAEVLHKEGEALAYLAQLVMRRLRRMAGNHEWVPPIAFAGSILEKVPPVRETVIAAVQREFRHVRTLAGVVDPIAGAVWRARHQ